MVFAVIYMFQPVDQVDITVLVPPDLVFGGVEK